MSRFQSINELYLYLIDFYEDDCKVIVRMPSEQGLYIFKIKRTVHVVIRDLPMIDKNSLIFNHDPANYLDWIFKG